MSKSTSLWYPRYVGDYKRKTSHLSMTEHGAYAMLMDHYYSSGKALPTSVAVLKRVCSAFEDHEVDALKSVLAEFFVEREGLYHHERADEELSKRSDISEKRKNAVNSRADRKATSVPTDEGTNEDTSTSTSIIDKKERIHVDLDDAISPERWGKINGTSTQAVADAVFDKWFWPSYPKIKCSKQDAKLAFRRALKTATASEIIVGVNRYFEKWEALPDDKKPFAKHAATWLNKKNWIDELEEIDNGS